MANATLNATSGWLAHIIVSEDQRNKGIGSQLTKHMVEYLAGRGCRTQLLIATKMGEGLYRKFGFRTVGEYAFFEEGAIASTETDQYIRPYGESDFEAVMELDRFVCAEDRQGMLSQFLTAASVYHSGSNIDGFFLPQFDEGMIITRNEAAGLALLKRKHSEKSRKTVLPVENRAGNKWLSDNGFVILSKAPRMLLGEEIPWKPQLIFSRAGGFYG